MEFYANAQKFYTVLSKFLMSDKNVPKKWRSVVTYPILNMADSFFDMLEDANSIYPNSENLVEERKARQLDCITHCEKIYGRLQRTMLTVWWDTLHRDEADPERVRLERHLTEIGELLDREVTLLKGWRRSTKLLQRK